MKRVIFRHKLSPAHRRKLVSIHETNSDKQVTTRIRKSFLYQLEIVRDGNTAEQDPEMFIHKQVDSARKYEEFWFRTKGSFCLVSGEDVVRVHFSHSLRIEMQWRQKAFSPKKSVTLT